MTAPILVLGARGFVGRRIVATLAAAREPVIGVVRRGAGEPHTVQADATDAAALARVLAGARGVVNCIVGDARTIVANAQALAAAAPRGVPVVHFSSMAVYGSATGIVDETAEPRGDTGWYGAAKAQAERALAGTAATILRPGIIYGPGSGQWSARIARLLQSRRLGDLGAAGDGACNLVHVDDVVAAALAALRVPGARGQAVNLGHPEPPTWNDYFLAYARALGAVPLARIPRWRLKLESLLGLPLKALELVAHRLRVPAAWLPPAITPSLLHTFGWDLRLEVTKAERLLGLRWRPLAQGLAQAAAEQRRG
jgi:nucleoside-diphosphate-sugar epimerase